MLRNFRLIGITLLILLAAAGCGLLQAPEEASGTLEAIPLELATDTPDTATPTTGADTAPAATSTDPAETETPGGESSTAEPRIYSIQPDESQVRFELDEDLRGVRTTVVGLTNQVAGEIAVNPNDLSTVQVGTLQINARTLQTDNSFRNRAIHNEILDSGQFELITFTPNAVNGLPEAAAPGETINFSIGGDLTIRDITRPVTFAVSATMDNEQQISGTAEALINRADFDLNIPSVQNVANVEEEVELYIDFVARSG